MMTPLALKFKGIKLRLKNLFTFKIGNNSNNTTHYYEPTKKEEPLSDGALVFLNQIKSLSPISFHTRTRAISQLHFFVGYDGMEELEELYVGFRYSKGENSFDLDKRKAALAELVRKGFLELDKSETDSRVSYTYLK